MENLQNFTPEEESSLDQTLMQDGEEATESELSISSQEETTPLDDKKIDEPEQEATDDPELELPEGVQYFAPPSSSSFLIPVVPSQPSTASVRWNALARPKEHHVRDTLQQFKKLLPKESVENLKKQLTEQTTLSQVQHREHLKRCSIPPVPQPPSGRRPPPVKEQRYGEIISKYNSQLKREAFDRLAGKIFEKLPDMVLEADISNLQQLPATMQRMTNVIFVTLVGYAGKPLTCHDHELYVHLSLGLAKFIGKVILSVQKQEAMKARQALPSRSMTAALFADSSEVLLNIQRSRGSLRNFKM